jgi:hypothetical protein
MATDGTTKRDTKAKRAAQGRAEERDGMATSITRNERPGDGQDEMPAELGSVDRKWVQTRLSL